MSKTKETKNREHICRVTIKDCKVQTFSAGGKGGQNQNRRSTGVRIIHPPSGAIGESREDRTQLENKKKAFRRMGESNRFRIWVNQICYITYSYSYGNSKVLAEVEKEMEPQFLQIEGRVNGKWTKISTLD